MLAEKEILNQLLLPLWRKAGMGGPRKKIEMRDKIQKSLLRWFEKNKRDLPWRRTKDPYAIWIAEIMLQQTQVATAIPYYERFLKLFPTVDRLARSDLNGVLAAWEGLGYYSRARNLHLAAKVIRNHFGGKLPDTLDDLLSLPGIGRYTAGAMLSIAFNKEAPILDGNVKRALSRIFTLSGKSERILWHLSESLIPFGHAGAFNQALMELGATICTPQEPRCHHCPVKICCKGRAMGDPQRYPSKTVKKRIPHVEAVSAAILRNGKVLINRRPLKGLLGGLWEFPNWELEDSTDMKRSLRTHLRKEMQIEIRVDDPVSTFKHTYSHFRLTLHSYHCRLISGAGKGEWVFIRDLPRFPMSKVHRLIAQSLATNPKLHER